MRLGPDWGLFHAAVGPLTQAGVYLMQRDARLGVSLPVPKTFTGHLLLGWGIVNLGEGPIDNHLLGLPHVRDLPAQVPLYDRPS